jgi:protocatechuate 3,4-dioxygenase beta subunit
MRKAASGCLAVVTGVLTAVAGLIPANGASAAAAPTPLPSPVHDVAAFDTGHAVRLTWTNPATRFAGVIVRYQPGGRAPASPADGTSVTPRQRSATHVALAGLTPGTRYSAAVWTYNARHDYSRRAITRFTTASAPVSDATISGTVTDRIGHPLENVQVFIETFDATEHGATATDANGHYSLAVAPGGYYVGFDGGLATGGTSDATGYIGDTTSVDGLAPGESRTGVDASLAPGAAIVGRVSDLDGHPLAGVVPNLQFASPYVNTTTSTSFAFFALFGPNATNPSAVNGTFTIKGLPASAAQVCLDPTLGPVTGGDSDLVGYVPRCTSRVVVTQVNRVRDIADVTLAGNSGGVLTGVVLDQSGLPVAGAFVDAEKLSRGGLRFAGSYDYTDASGRYRFAVPAGRYQVCASPEAGDVVDGGVNGTDACGRTPVDVTVGHVASADIQLSPAGAVAGRIVGPDGQPVADAFVDVRSANRRIHSFGEAVTDVSGYYRATGLTAGAYFACVDPPPIPSDTYPTGIAQGCVRRTSPVDVRIGLTRLGLDGRLGVGGAVSGQITDDSGSPTSDALVDVMSLGGRFGWEVGVDPDGSYLVAGLPSGRYRVCATWIPPFDTDGVFFGFGFVDECRTPIVQINAGQTTAGVNRSVATGGSVTVSVRDANGQPVAGVDVAALSRCPRNAYCSTIPLFRPQRQVSVDESEVTSVDGIARLHGLRPGQYAICLFGYYAATAVNSSPTGYPDSCAGHTYNVTVANHETTTVHRQLGIAGAVSGSVTDAAGHPLSHVRISVSNAATSDYVDPNDFGDYVPAGPAADAVTDTNGHFTIRGVTPGEQTVCFNARHARGASTTGYVDTCVGGDDPSSATPVDIEPGQRTSVHVSLAAGAAISGAVTDTRGHPLRADVYAIDLAGGGWITTAHRDGTYRIPRLAAGTYEVCFIEYRYRSQCYDHVFWPDRHLPANARKLVLTPGDDRRGIDATLHKLS